MTSSFSGNGSNGHNWSRLTVEEVDEIKAQVEQEFKDVMAGQKENALFLQALAGNWSLRDVVNVALFHGKSWRFVSALADKSLEIQGWGMLDFLADAVGRDMAEQILRKALATLERVKKIEEDYKASHGDDPFAEQIFEEMRTDLTAWARESRQRYWVRIGRLME